MNEPVTVYLGLGSNVGDRKQQMVDALRLLSPEAKVEAVSSLYETEPVGPVEQDDFYNAACRVSTPLSPQDLLTHIKHVERDAGRTKRQPWGPREIDIDILLYGEEQVREATLQVPHSELTRRAFALVPLSEIAPDAVHPDTGESIATLTSRVDAKGMRKVADAGWEA